MGAEGVVGTTCLAEGLAHRLLSDCIEVIDSDPHLLVDLVSDGKHLINGEAVCGLGVDLSELVQDLLKGVARKSLEIPESAVDVEGYGCDLGEVGHFFVGSAISIIRNLLRFRLKRARIV